MHAIIRASGPEPVSGPFRDEAGINHPANVLTLWSDEDLAAIGVHSIVEPAIPEGKVSTGSTLTWDGQSVTRVHTLADAPPPALDDYKRAIQGHIDATAQAKDYGDGVACASYVASANPTWQAEAIAFVHWRDGVWSHAYAELARVLAGEREQPSVAELVAELPAIVWPA